MKAIFLFLIAIILLSGCVAQTSEKDRAASACIEECKSATQDLSNGPCLSNEIISDWVCDVAHSPRIVVDNQPENQCSSYGEGLANHFVEVDKTCNFIRAI